MCHFPAIAEKKGFSLVEIVLALGICVFVVISMVGLLSVGLKNDRTAQDESAAVTLLGQVTADLRNSGTNPVSPIFGISPTPGMFIGVQPERISPSSAVVGEDASKRYLVKVSYITNSGLAPVQAHIAVIWPADAAAAGGVVQQLEAICSFPRP